MTNKNTLIIILSILLVVILVWGLIGSSQAAEVGVTCDFGLGKEGSIFCWDWHKNALGELGDALENIFSE